MKPQSPQECKNHTMWQRHLSVAHYALLGAGIVLAIFGDRILAGIILAFAGVSIHLFGARLELKHIQWHAEQEKEGRNM